jgi:hypothetical protein
VALKVAPRAVQQPQPQLPQQGYNQPFAQQGNQQFDRQSQQQFPQQGLYSAKPPQKQPRVLDFPLEAAAKVLPSSPIAPPVVAGGWGAFVEEESDASDQDDFVSISKQASEQQQLALARNGIYNMIVIQVV